jgi:hypothetical protein
MMPWLRKLAKHASAVRLPISASAASVPTAGHAPRPLSSQRSARPKSTPFASGRRFIVFGNRHALTIAVTRNDMALGRDR